MRVPRSALAFGITAALVLAVAPTAFSHPEYQSDGAYTDDGDRDAHQHGESDGHLPATNSNVSVVSKLKLKNAVPETALKDIRERLQAKNERRLEVMLRRQARQAASGQAGQAQRWIIHIHPAARDRFCGHLCPSAPACRPAGPSAVIRMAPRRRLHHGRTSLLCLYP